MVVAEPVVSRGRLRGRLTVSIVSTASAAAGPAGSVTRGRVVSSGRRVITVPLGPRSTIVSTGSSVISRVITVCALAAPAPAASASATAAWRICVLMGFSLQSPDCPKQQVNAGFPSPVPMEPGRLRRTSGGRGHLRHIHTYPQGPAAARAMRPQWRRNTSRHQPETPTHYGPLSIGRQLMLMAELIGAALLLLCLAPLLARDPAARRPSR